MMERSRIVKSLLIAVVLSAAASPARAADAIDAVGVTDDKSAKLLKLQRLNRVFEVVYGRSMKKSEALPLLGLRRGQIKARFLQGDELRDVFARRLTAYAAGGDGMNLMDQAASPAVAPLADPTKRLSLVLTSVTGSAQNRRQDVSRLSSRRHGGMQCSSRSPAVCFARWLTGRVAPGLAPEWLAQYEAQIPNMTYASLLEKIVLASIGAPT